LAESAVDGDVLLSNEVAEGYVWIVARERAVRAGGVTVLLTVRIIAVIDDGEWSYPKTDQNVFQRFAGVDVDHTDVQF